MPTAITSWGVAIKTALTTAFMMFFAAIPKVIGFLIILGIGWFIADLIAKGVAALLRAVHFDDLSRRAGLSDFIQKTGTKNDASGVLALVVKWVVRLIVLGIAFDALGLPAVSNLFNQFLLWLPNLVVAMIVLVVGGLVANFVADIVRGATAESGLGSPNAMAAIARFAIWAFAVIVAVNQIGVAQTLVNTLFMGIVAILVLALGLSFGLGARDTAGEIVRKWYNRAQGAAPKVAQAAQIASMRATGAAGSAPGGQGMEGEMASDQRSVDEALRVRRNDDMNP